MIKLLVPQSHLTGIEMSCQKALPCLLFPPQSHLTGIEIRLHHASHDQLDTLNRTLLELK